MTAQISDILNYKDKAHPICNEPLKTLLSNRSIRFQKPDTAINRGYIASWKLIDNKLYLINLKAYIDYDTVVDLDYLFPNQKEVIADWFTGEIKVIIGKLIEYKHMGYDSIYEKNLCLEFIDGILVKEYLVNNNTLFKKISRRIKNKVNRFLSRYDDGDLSDDEFLRK